MDSPAQLCLRVRVWKPSLSLVRFLPTSFFLFKRLLGEQQSQCIAFVSRLRSNLPSLCWFSVTTFCRLVDEWGNSYGASNILWEISMLTSAKRKRDEISLFWLLPGIPEIPLVTRQSWQGKDWGSLFCISLKASSYGGSFRSGRRSALDSSFDYFGHTRFLTDISSLNRLLGCKEDTNEVIYRTKLLL